MQIRILNTDIFTMMEAASLSKQEIFLITVSADGHITDLYGTSASPFGYMIHSTISEFYTTDNNIHIMMTKSEIEKIPRFMKSWDFSSLEDDKLICIVDYVDNIETYHIELNHNAIPDYYNVYNQFISIINKINMANANTVMRYGSIKQNTAVETMMAGKVSNGVTPLIIDNKFYMYIYKGIVPLLKADDLLLDILLPIDYENSKVFIARFTVAKKKNIKISFHYWYVNLI